MDVEAARYLGAGLASIALIGAGVGIGIIFGNYLAGALRNPGAAQGQFTNLLVGFALCEFTGLHGGRSIHKIDPERHADRLQSVAAGVAQPGPTGALDKVATPSCPLSAVWLEAAAECRLLDRPGVVAGYRRSIRRVDPHRFLSAARCPHPAQRRAYSRVIESRFAYRR